MPKKTKRRRIKNKDACFLIKQYRKFLLWVILLLVCLVGSYFVYNKVLIKKETSFYAEKPRLADVAVYPGSSEKFFVQKDNLITINYRSGIGVDYHKVINFYLDSLPKLGWKLVSVSDVEAVFQKGEKKLKVWILYKNRKNDRAVDYIIDYYLGENLGRTAK